MSADPRETHLRDQFDAAAREAREEAIELKDHLKDEDVKRVTESHEGIAEGSALDKVIEHWHYLTFKDPDRDNTHCQHLQPKIGVFWGILGMPGYLGCRNCTIEMLNLTTRIYEILAGHIRCDCCREDFPVENEDNMIVNMLLNTGPVNLFGMICKNCASEAGYQKEMNFD